MQARRKTKALLAAATTLTALSCTQIVGIDWDAYSVPPTSTSTGGQHAGGTGTYTGGQAGAGGHQAGAGGHQAGAGGHQAGAGGTGGSAPPTCGNQVFEPGEVCFGQGYIDYEIGAQEPYELVIVDCDGDLHPDIVTVNFQSNTVTALRNIYGDGVFNAAPIHSATGFEPTSIAAGDLDGQGRIDLVTAHGNAANFLTPLFANATQDCKFDAQPAITLPSTPLHEPEDVVIANIDDTGGDDIVFSLRVNGSPNDDGVGVWLNGQPTSTVQKYLHNEYLAPTGVAAAQFDSQPGDDVVYAQTDFNKLFLRLNKAGTLGPAADVPTYGEIGHRPWAIVTGNMDGDNDIDLVVTNIWGNTVSVVINDTAPSFSQQAPVSVCNDHGQGGACWASEIGGSSGVGGAGGTTGLAALEPRELALFDIDGDGDLDVVTANSALVKDKSSVSLLLNNGSGVLQLATANNFPNTTISGDFPIMVGKRAYGIAVVDLNDDGAPDIVTANKSDTTGTSHISVLLANP